MNCMDLTLMVGVPEDQAAAVAKILYNAFEDKFRKLFGPKKRAIPLISNHLRHDRTVVALHEGTVVGVGGLTFEGKESIDINFSQLVRTLKWGILRFMFYHWIFENEGNQNEILVDMVAVIEPVRGKGIGRALMTFIIEYARAKGYEQVSLFVIDTNTKAKLFYERIGFKEKKMHNLLFPWNILLGFNGAFEMVYTLYGDEYYTTIKR